MGNVFQPATPIGTVCVAMVTPMHANGEIDYQAAAKLARKLVDDGCDSILVSGTTGESPTTHQAEKDKLTSAVVEAVGQDAYVLAGAGSNDTAHAVRIAQRAQACGADGLLVVSPYYNRPSQRGVIRHVEAIIDATDLPITLYDIPGRTGVAFSDDTLDHLAQSERIVAVKDATGNPEQGLQRMERTGLAYYSGDDGLNYAFLTGGASGVISVVGHVAAAQYRKMVDLVADGQYPAARAVHRQLQPLVEAIMGGGQGAVMAKAALYQQGFIPTDAVRSPLAPADEQDYARIAQWR
ncbi:MAG: 4-hydroxy-tetrahydrodipicolinate synthase [Actinomycetaceae bacterium]|nr:4-hydroxy-tetrahydrodipicolinate synthase [Actinomycetaceae bacterium]